MLLHNYIELDSYMLSLIKNSIKEISNQEIQNIKKRIDFQLNHYMISMKKISTEAGEKKLAYFRFINEMLENELKIRLYEYSTC